LPENVERIGFIVEPWVWLCRMQVVAVLSPLGRGCKTTVTDALAAGCHVWVHPRQHARLPAAERERTIPVDPDSENDVRRAVDQSQQPPKNRPYDRMADVRAAWKGVLGL